MVGHLWPWTGIFAKTSSMMAISSASNETNFEFSSTLSTVVAPGSGIIRGIPGLWLNALTHPIATWAIYYQIQLFWHFELGISALTVHPLCCAIFLTSSTSFIFSSKTSGWNLGYILRISFSGRSSKLLICPVKKPCESGAYARIAMPSSAHVAATPFVSLDI